MRRSLPPPRPAGPAASRGGTPRRAGRGAPPLRLAGRDARHVAGLEIVLEPGWHTYWRVPGAAGIPPRFDWSGSTNLGDARIEWPHPQVFEVFGFRTIGYHDRVVLPMLLTPVTARSADRPAPDGQLRRVQGQSASRPRRDLSGRLVPEAAPPERAAGHRGGPRAARPSRRRGRRSRRDVPARAERRGHALAARVQLSRAPGQAPGRRDRGRARPDIWIGETRAETSGAVVTAEAPVEAAGQAGFALDRSGLRLTLIDTGPDGRDRGLPRPRLTD
jgi:hypothetical protein